MAVRKILVTNTDGPRAGRLRPLRLTTAAGLARKAGVTVGYMRTRLREQGAPQPLEVAGGNQSIYLEDEAWPWWLGLPSTNDQELGN